MLMNGATTETYQYLVYIQLYNIMFLFLVTVFAFLSAESHGFTTGRPMITTESVMTTESPIFTTEADSGTTESPIFTTESDSGTTESEIFTTESDSGTTESQIFTTEADSGTTESHIFTTEADSGTTESQIFTTEADSGTTESQIFTTESDSGTTESQIFTTESDSGTTESPIFTTESHVGTTVRPVFPEIAMFDDDYGVPVWNNRGMVGSGSFASYRADLAGLQNWRILGDRGQEQHGDLEAQVPMFYDLSGTAFATPVDFQWVWDDRLSTSLSDGSTWSVVCPDGYTGLGDYFYDENRITTPDRLYNVATCIRNDLTVPCSYGERIYTDAGSTAWYDLTVWEMESPAGHVTTEFFRSVGNHDAIPPNDILARCISPTAVLRL